MALYSYSTKMRRIFYCASQAPDTHLVFSSTVLEQKVEVCQDPDVVEVGIGVDIGVDFDIINL